MAAALNPFLGLDPFLATQLPPWVRGAEREGTPGLASPTCALAQACLAHACAALSIIPDSHLLACPLRPSRNRRAQAKGDSFLIPSLL